MSFPIPDMIRRSSGRLATSAVMLAVAHDVPGHCSTAADP